MTVHLPSPVRSAREAMRVAAVRPDLKAGLRAAVLTVVPLVLVPLTGRPELVWTGFAGFVATLADKGGAYRTRARSMAAVTILGALAALLGGLAAPHFGLSVGLVAVGAFLCGFARSLGAEPAAVGTGVATVLVLGVARPSPDLAEAVTRAGYVLLGGAWAMFFALVLWPIRVFRPYRFMTAAVLRDIAAFNAALAEEPALDSEAWHARRGTLVAQVRSSIEAARAGLGALRRGRPGPSARGELLLVVVETADQLFETSTAIGETLPLTDAGVQDAMRGALRRAAGVLRDLADGLVAERARVVPAWLASADPSATALVQRHGRELRTIALAAAALEGPNSGVNPGRSVARPLPVASTGWRELAGAWSLGSAPVRHALRTAVGTAGALWAGRALHFGHEYWAALTAFVILQPSGAATFTRALQRVAGTVVGAVVAALVVARMHDSHAIMLVVFVSIVIGVALLPLNYGLFAVFVTPAFVILASMSSAENDLPLARVLNTVAGSGLALVLSVAFLPTHEEAQIPVLFGRVLAELRALAAVAFGPSDPAALAATRQRVGVALVNADASFQRHVSDRPVPATEQEALQSMLIYAHRLAATLISIAVARPAGAAPLPDVGCDAALAGIAEALATGTPPPPLVLPQMPAVDDHVMQARLDRLAQQLGILHASVGRWLRSA